MSVTGESLFLCSTTVERAAAARSSSVSFARHAVSDATSLASLVCLSFRNARDARVGRRCSPGWTAGGRR